MQLHAQTLQIVILANFVALAVVWTYVVRSYPTLNAAGCWTASAWAAAGGALVSLLRPVMDPLLPITVGNSLMILACCLSWAGIRQFYNQPIPVRTSAVVVVATGALLGALALLGKDVNLRLAVFSVAECIPLGLALRDLRARPEPGRSPGAELASTMIICVMLIHALRSVCGFLGLGGPISVVTFNGVQAAAFLLLIFTSMMANFGFILMAIDRLRAEVAGLALVDDLTGIANRRHFLIRLTEACSRASRLEEPFGLLVIDLDGFKAINDSYGHSAGDECLRTFTRVAQAHLRIGDLLARTGGDEFCVILPSTTLSESALVARNLVKACRGTALHWHGLQLSMTASIGIAVWSDDIGHDSQKLIAEADHALYVAKKQGRDRLAVHQHTVRLLRKSA
ncbi:GGDEF domain-containing protein [Bradyrhizobium sp. 2TAF24]|uniref:GGDEF domain-containing protein n=1 Tax=Bradyrhizobium sp. 2TAF24 TaxID=3233011 RepID=UPI003F92CDA9